MTTTREGRRPPEGERGWTDRLNPVRVVDLVQTFKTALAGGLAWWIATDVAHLEQPFLSPWAAVLVVHATVYKTVSRGGQQVAATFVGVFLAFLLGQLRWVKEEAGTIATTGLVTLATGSIARGDLLASRWIDTAVGVGVGLAVNLLVWPPLRDRAAWARAEEIPGDLAAVLREMADGLGSDLDPKDTKRWVRGIRQVDLHIDEAWRLLWEAKESGRLNPRRSQPTGVHDLKKLLHALEQGVADSLSMARNIAGSAEAGNVWDESFRERWRAVATRTADLTEAEDLDGLRGLCEELESMTEDFSSAQLGPETWREYAGLLMNLRNVHDALTNAVDWMTESTPDRRRGKRFDTPQVLVRRRRPGQAGQQGQPGRPNQPGQPGSPS